MKAITKIAKTALLTTMAVVSLVGAAQSPAPSAEDVARVLVERLMSGNGDYHTDTAKKLLDADKTVMHFVASAHSKSAKEYEREKSGGVMTLNQRRSEALEAVQLLEEERLPYSQKITLFMSVSGEKRNMAWTSEAACVVMMDPAETNDLVARIKAIDEKVFRKFIAQHELSHCMYVERRKLQGGRTSDEDIMRALDIKGLDEKVFAELLKKEMGMAGFEEMVRETYADVYALMSGAKNNWVKDWGGLLENVKRFRNDKESDAYTEDHDTSFALEKLANDYSKETLQAMSGKEREAIAERLAIQGAWASFTVANKVSKELTKLVGKTFDLSANDAYKNNKIAQAKIKQELERSEYRASQTKLSLR